MKLEQDWHVHTHRSLCGKPENTVSAITQTLDAHDMRLAGLSDHVDTPEQRGWFAQVVLDNRMDLEGLSPTCRIMIGTEASMLSPNRCALDAAMASELDFVMVACNHYHLDVVENPSQEDPAAYAAHHLEMLEGAASLGFVDTVAHPFLISKLGPETALEVLEHYDQTRLGDVLSAAAQADMAFEINPYACRHAIPWFRDLVAEARRRGAQFTLGSDSHTLGNIGFVPDGADLSPVEVCDAIGLAERDLKWP